MLKKIYTILVLIKNFIIRKRHYTLHFVSENNGHFKRWYYDFKHWGFEHANLEMVAGADTLCEHYSENGNETTVDIIASNKKLNIKDYDEYIGDSIYSTTTGRDYTNITFNGNILTNNSMWICPITLFVLGRYPNYIYVKVHKHK